MEEDKLYVTCAEAASMLAVSQESIRNFIKRGVLDGRFMKRKCVVLLSSIEQYASMDMTTLEQKQKALEKMQDYVDSYTKELEATRRNILREARLMEEGLVVDDVLRNLFSKRYQLADLFGCFVSLMEEKTGRYTAAEVMRGVIAGESYERIGKRLGGLSHERVRQIFHKGVRSIRNLDSYFDLLDENKQLNEKIHCLEAELRILRSENVSLNELHANENSPVSAFNKKYMVEMMQHSILNTDIRHSSLNLSMRIINVLTYKDIHILYELVKLSRKEIAKMRNLGKKSVLEIDKMLEANGLELGMTDLDIYNWLLVNKSITTNP